MTREELIRILSALPDNSEVLVDIGERKAEIKYIRLEFFQRDDKVKPYVIIDIYK